MNRQAVANEAFRLSGLTGNCGRVMRRFLSRLPQPLSIPVAEVAPELRTRYGLMLRLRQHDLDRCCLVPPELMHYRKGRGAALVLDLKLDLISDLSVSCMRARLAQVGYFLFGLPDAEEIRASSEKGMRWALREIEAQAAPEIVCPLLAVLQSKLAA